MFVIMALKNLRRRDLRPKGPDHNHGELAPRITRLAWARESKASHRVSALSGEPSPPQARSDPAAQARAFSGEGHSEEWGFFFSDPSH